MKYKCTLGGIILLAVALLIGPVAKAEAQIPEKIRIGVVASEGRAPYKNASIIKFSAQGNYQVIDGTAFPGTEVIGEVKEGATWQVAYLTTGIQIIVDGNPLKITSGPVIIKEVTHSGENLVVLKSYIPKDSSEKTINKHYRGNMEFRIGSGYLIGVNELPLEEYLYGVVPSEMISSWPVEALKAQALAARNYAVQNYNKRVVNGYNLLDTVDDQAYGGVNNEAERVTQAVYATAGELILYEGKPITAYYHSNSGGYTENSENVWVSAVPYLKGIPDPYSLEGKRGNWKYETVARGLDAKGRKGVEEKLKEIDSNFGTLAGFELEKYPSGRVEKILISDNKGYTIEKTGNQFGKLFNPYFYTYLDEDSFLSNLFDIVTDNFITVMDASEEIKTIQGGASLKVINDDGVISAINNDNVKFSISDGIEVNEANNYPQNIEVIGHGWGHGVGMSQWGAYQMAKEGKTYKEILTHYYTGVTISEKY